MASELARLQLILVLLAGIITDIDVQACIRKTVGSNGVGAGYTCIFPFTYAGVTYTDCTDYDSTAVWCATQVDALGVMGYGTWADCGPCQADEGLVAATVSLVNNGGSGCTTGAQCIQCNGDCDKDSQCAPGLKCFQRSGYTAVPGCLSGGAGEKHNYDYCYDEAANYCIPREASLTASIMQTYCGHQSYDVDRSPTVEACDTTLTSNVRDALANGMFGGDDGPGRNCNAWCLYDIDDPAGRAYSWKPSDSCWIVSDSCDAEKSYAMQRSARFCQALTKTCTTGAGIGCASCVAVSSRSSDVHCDICGTICQVMACQHDAISLSFPTFGYENSFDIISNNQVVCSSGRWFESSSTYISHIGCCLEVGAYTLVCKDSYGDGWHGGYITIDGNNLCSSFLDGSGNHEKTEQFDIKANCSITDGTSISARYPCNCGTAICPSGHVCFSSTNFCQGDCSITNGTSISAEYPCKCGTALCESDHVCNSSTSTCQATCGAYMCPAGFGIQNRASTNITQYNCCQACIANCKTCTDDTSCTLCNGGFYFDGTVCKACSANCNVCTDSTKCTACISGFYINGTACQAYACIMGSGTGCKSCKNQADRTSDETCATCNAGYYEVNGACQAYACNTGSGIGCMTCKTQANRTSNETCATCNAGFYEVSGTCQACIGGSTRRRASSQCTQCESGYYDNGDYDDREACSLDCVDCVNASICMTCGNGRYLNSLTCVEACPLTYPGGYVSTQVAGAGATGGTCEVQLTYLLTTCESVCILNGSELRGAIPPDIGSFTTIETLYLDNNTLGSTVPSELGKLVNLQSLSLANCTLDSDSGR